MSERDESVRPGTGRDGKERDGGFTLVELVVSIVITGLMLSAISFALLFMLDSTNRTESAVSEARDITFVQTWLPIDMASAVSFDTDPLADPTAGDILPGTNVMVIERQDLTSPGAPNYFIAYRYVDAGDEWQLIRYEVRMVGSPPVEEVFTVGVAHELMPPPADGSWDPALRPEHAVKVTGRNPVVLRKSGRDVEMRFVGGGTFTTGGAGLGPGDFLPAGNAGGFVDPKSPPSRCGGNITLILDSSGSIGTNMSYVRNAAREIVGNFQGTPTELRIIHFNSSAIALVPNTWNGPAIDMLNLTDGEKTVVNTTINSLTAGGWTNWEAALRMAITDYSNRVSILKSPHLPNTVIFMTDGEPTRHVNSSGADTGNGTNIPLYASQAKEISDYKAEWGVEFKGIYVQRGDGGATAANAQQLLKDIVGSTEFVRTPPPIGNADAASFFVGEFEELADIFQQLFAANCGGTVTIQKRIQSGPSTVVPTNGTWHYSTSNGTRDLDATISSSITFDYQLGVAGAQWVPITEEPVPGYLLSDVRCYRRGQDVTISRVRELRDENNQVLPNGREVLVNPNEAMSCQFISS